MRRAQATQLRDGLKTLRLATIRECYREQADLARKETLTYEGYLLFIKPSAMLRVRFSLCM